MEAKLAQEDEFIVYNFNMNMWRKDREEGVEGSVVIMVWSGMKVMKVEYRQGRTETVSVKLKG